MDPKTGQIVPVVDEDGLEAYCSRADLSGWEFGLSDGAESIRAKATVKGLPGDRMRVTVDLPRDAAILHALLALSLDK